MQIIGPPGSKSDRPVGHASVLWKMLVALKILIFELRKPQKWILRAILRGTWTPLTTSNNQNWLNEAETRQKALISAPILCTLNQPKLTICPFHIHALPKVSLRLSVWTLHWNSCPQLVKTCVKSLFWRQKCVPAKSPLSFLEISIGSRQKLSHFYDWQKYLDIFFNDWEAVFNWDFHIKVDRKSMMSWQWSNANFPRWFHFRALNQHNSNRFWVTLT